MWRHSTYARPRIRKPFRLQKRLSINLLQTLNGLSSLARRVSRDWEAPSANELIDIPQMKAMHFPPFIRNLKNSLESNIRGPSRNPMKNPINPITYQSEPSKAPNNTAKRQGKPSQRPLLCTILDIPLNPHNQLSNPLLSIPKSARSASSLLANVTYPIPRYPPVR